MISVCIDILKRAGVVLCRRSSVAVCCLAFAAAGVLYSGDGFEVTPFVELWGGYDDNLELADIGEKGGLVFGLQAGAAWRWERNPWSFDLDYALSRDQSLTRTDLQRTIGVSEEWSWRHDLEGVFSFENALHTAWALRAAAAEQTTEHYETTLHQLTIGGLVDRPAGTHWILHADLNLSTHDYFDDPSGRVDRLGDAAGGLSYFFSTAGVLYGEYRLVAADSTLAEEDYRGRIAVGTITFPAGPETSIRIMAQHSVSDFEAGRRRTTFLVAPALVMGSGPHTQMVLEYQRVSYTETGMPDIEVNRFILQFRREF